MSGERAFFLFVTVALVAALGWRATTALTPNVITPDPENMGPVAVKAPGTITNLVTASAVPMRLIWGPYMFLPPVTPYAINREDRNAGC